MKILFFGIHGIISLSMFEDLMAACAAAGHSVFYEFEGYEKERAELLCKRGGYTHMAVDPDLMIVADPREWPKDRGCPVVDINHGLASKHNYYYKTTKYTSDFFFCPSEWIAGRLESKKTKFIAAGMPKLDRVTNETDGRTVLLCPTHNPRYNCLEMLQGVVGELCEQYRVIIKPHMYSFSGGKYQAFANLVAALKLECRHDYNIADLLSSADIVISDVSSAWLEALALGKRVVTCETPAAYEHKEEKPLSHEAMFSEFVEVVRDGSELLEAVERSKPCAPEIADRLLSYRGESIPRILSLFEEVA